MNEPSWYRRPALLATILLAVVACAVTVHVEIGEQGMVFHFEAYVGQLPAGAKPLPLKASYTDPITGEEVVGVEIYDTDGDGQGDHAKLPDGKIVKGTLTPAGPEELTFNPGHGAPLTQLGQQQHKPFVFVPYLNPPANPMPVVFTKSVDDYLADHGLNSIVRGDNSASDAIELLGADAGTAYPSGFMLDVRLHWNTEAGWTDIEQFPSLAYEFYGLSDAPHTWPHYVQARVAGDAGVVLNWLGHHGVTQVDTFGLHVTGTPLGDFNIGHLAIVIDEAAGLAVITADTEAFTIALGW